MPLRGRLVAKVARLARDNPRDPEVEAMTEPRLLVLRKAQDAG